MEKILDPGEKLRASWPVEGTVGYEFLNDAAALFVDPSGHDRLTALWHDLSGDPRPFSDYAAEAKLEQASTTFTAEVERLARSFPRDDLPEALSSLPVYRTYIRDGKASAEDREVLAEAGIEWLLDAPPEFVTRFQQTTPPVMAKGVEDTAFYRYLRLLALNDVGGDPGRFGLPIADFHAANAERAPLNLLVTQTHDTKRSGDVRARIGAIAGMAEAWEAHVRGWLELTSEVPGPDDAERYLVFQTLAGAWPIEPERLDGYLEKALREAKRTTSWIDPDEAHEAAVKAYARGLIELPEFRADFDPFVAELAAAGERAALGQLLLKLTVPGLPDIYNGDELPLLSLVDPDNRRPVDWAARREALAALRRGEDADPKLLLIVRALELRARRPERVLRRLRARRGGRGRRRVRARGGGGAGRRAGALAPGRHAPAPRRPRRRLARRADRRPARAVTPHAGHRAHLGARLRAARARLTKPPKIASAVAGWPARCSASAARAVASSVPAPASQSP